MSLARKYGDLVDKEDLNHLVSSLPGGISEIARRCKLTRRTLYRLQQEENIRQETKIKILDACLQTGPSETLRYLVRRSKDKSASILLTFLSSIYESAITAESPEEFKTRLDSFVEARREHFGLVSDEIEDEIGTMLRFLEQKASELMVELPVEDLETTRCSQLVEIIPRLIRDIYVGRHTSEDLSKMYNLPVELTRAFSDSLVTPARIEAREAKMQAFKFMRAQKLDFQWLSKYSAVVLPPIRRKHFQTFERKVFSYSSEPSRAFHFSAELVNREIETDSFNPLVRGRR